MLLSTPGLVLHSTPYAETSVVCKIFTRQAGVRSYIVKGVRGGGRSRVKQNMLGPLCSLDMVVYDNPRSGLNYVREMSPRHPAAASEPVANALRLFMTEVLYKALREEEPMPDLWDYVEEACTRLGGPTDEAATMPIRFMLGLAEHLGVMPMDNRTAAEPYFDLEQGRYVGAQTDTTLTAALSALLHNYLNGERKTENGGRGTGAERRDLLAALIAYYQMHLPGFRGITSHQILHTILR